MLNIVFGSGGWMDGGKQARIAGAGGWRSWRSVVFSAFVPCV